MDNQLKAYFEETLSAESEEKVSIPPWFYTESICRKIIEKIQARNFSGNVDDSCREDIRVAMWHTQEKRKIAGNAAPLLKNFGRYQQSHPQCVAYALQDWFENDSYRRRLRKRMAAAVAQVAAALNDLGLAPVREEAQFYQSNLETDRMRAHAGTCIGTKMSSGYVPKAELYTLPLIQYSGYYGSPRERLTPLEIELQSKMEVKQSFRLGGSWYTKERVSGAAASGRTEELDIPPSLVVPSTFGELEHHCPNIFEYFSSLSQN